MPGTVTLRRQYQSIQVPGGRERTCLERSFAA